MRFVTMSVCTALMFAGMSGTASAQPADECRSYGAENVADIRSYYANYDRSVVVQQTRYDDSTSWICVHAALRTLAGVGGKFIVTGVALTPVVDNNVSYCPQSGDLLAGQLGDPGNPSTYLPYRVSSISDSATVTVCVTLGSTNVRATYPVISEAPTVNFVPNSGTSYLAPEPTNYYVAGGSASSTCNGGSSVFYTDSKNLAWYRLYGGTEGFVQVYSTDVCYRAVTPSGTRGGLVRPSLGSYDIWLPANTTSSASCTTVLSATTAPVPTKISTGSDSGKTYVCAEAVANVVAVVADPNPRAPQVLSAPGVTHTQD